MTEDGAAGPEADQYGVDELQRRQRRALAMGGEARLARQRDKGRLDARQRIAALLDRDSFDEQGLLAVSEWPGMEEKTPADGKITGFGSIDARTVAVGADDVTVLAGAGGYVGTNKTAAVFAYARQKGYPCVYLGDAGGARVPDIMGSTGMMRMSYPSELPPRNRAVPMITAIMGDSFGGPTWYAAISDVVVQVKGAVMAVGGTAILEVATGETSSHAELGSWEMHARQTGLVDLFADSEAECLALLRRLLGYFPSSAQQLPPRAACADPPEARLDGVFDIVPADRRQAYDMHDLLQLIADEGSLLELKPHYDPSLITALARVDGQVVGLLANNPLASAGAMGPGACEKAVSFICLCDSYHIPLIFLHDTPGFLVGRAAEERKMPNRIMQFIECLAQSTVPRVSIVVRKSYGMAHCNMSGGRANNDILLAWPTADISFMAPEVAVNVAYGRKLQRAGDAELARREALAALAEGTAPWSAAGRNLIDKVIDPRDTRREIVIALRRAAGSDGSRGFSNRQLANWPYKI